ncbi:hypothetical protein FRC01_003749, partial [Tulasnella sp. 417]
MHWRLPSLTEVLRLTPDSDEDAASKVTFSSISSSPEDQRCRNLDEMPEDILVLILDDLDTVSQFRLARTCRYLQHDYCASEYQAACLHRTLMNRPSLIQHICSYHGQMMSTFIVPTPKRSFSERYISKKTKGSMIKAEALERAVAIFSQATNIVDLNLITWHPEWTSESDLFFKPIRLAVAKMSLKRLTLSDCRDVHHILRDQPELEELELGCYTSGVDQLEETDLPRLRSLVAPLRDAAVLAPGRPIKNMHLIRMIGNEYDFDEQLVEKLSLSTGPFTEFSVNLLHLLSEDELRVMLQLMSRSLPKLERLTTLETGRISGQVILEEMPAFQSLRSLNLLEAYLATVGAQSPVYFHDIIDPSPIDGPSTLPAMKQPLYLLFAVAQTTAAVLSATILVVNRVRNPTGKIKLPIFTEASVDRAYASDGLDGAEELEGGDKVDPFDVSIPLDFVDGTPIDEDRFWDSMQIRKVVQTALLVLLVVLDAISLGWLIIVDDSSAEIPHLVASSLQLAFSFYILVLSLYTIGEVEVEAHWTSVTHIWSMVTLATSLYATRLLLPKSLTPAPEAPFTKVFDFASLALYLILFAFTSSTNRGPKVHFPPERIYSAKTLSSSAPTAYANVTGYVRESIYSILLFAYTTPVIMLGYTAESLEIRDLPIIPADVRATPIFTSMRRVYKSIKLPKMWQSKAGMGWELLYKLFKVNWSTFLVQMSLASVTAVLYYVPAYFLQALVHFLEISDAGGKPDASWGWVYCAGLFFSIAINYILTGQLWSLSTTKLQVRLRVQLNTMLFAKTLVRKDIASAAAPTTAPSSPASTGPNTPRTTSPSSPAPGSPAAAVHSAPLPEEGDNIHIEGAPAEKNEEEDFSTKAQIMTLMTTDVDRVSEFALHMFSLV